MKELIIKQTLCVSLTTIPRVMGIRLKTISMLNGNFCNACYAPYVRAMLVFLKVVRLSFLILPVFIDKWPV